MDLVELFFRAIGAFYLFAAHVGARAMLFGAVADRMIATMSDVPDNGDIAGKHTVLGAGVVMTATGGVALTLMTFWALPIFVANLALQTAWLIWARQTFPPRNAAEFRGRRRKTNATIAYGVLAIGVFWLWKEGRLGEADDPLPAGLLLATTVFFAAWLIRDLKWRPSPGEIFDDPDLPPEPAERPQRVRLDPCFGSWPLINADTGRRFNHLTWLPEHLAFRIEDWDDAFQLAFDPDTPASQPDFGKAEHAAAYVEEGREIVLALCDHFGAESVEVSATFDTNTDKA